MAPRALLALLQGVAALHHSGAEERLASARLDAGVRMLGGPDTMQEGEVQAFVDAAGCLPPRDVIEDRVCGEALHTITDPLVFGPIVWPALHLIAATYPEEPSEAQQGAAVAFLTSLPFMLPCGHCGYHLHEFLGVHDLPGAAGSRGALTELLVSAHNSVSRAVSAVDPGLPAKREWTAAEALAAYTCAGSCAADPRVWRALFAFAAGYHSPNGTSDGGDAPPLLRTRAAAFLRALPALLPCAECGERLGQFLGARDLATDVATKEGFIAVVAEAHADVATFVSEEKLAYEGGFPPEMLLTASDLRAKYFCLPVCLTDPRVWSEEDKELWQDVADHPDKYM